MRRRRRSLTAGASCSVLACGSGGRKHQRDGRGFVSAALDSTQRRGRRTSAARKCARFFSRPFGQRPGFRRSRSKLAVRRLQQKGAGNLRRWNLRITCDVRFRDGSRTGLGKACQRRRTLPAQDGDRRQTRGEQLLGGLSWGSECGFSGQQGGAFRLDGRFLLSLHRKPRAGTRAKGKTSSLGCPPSRLTSLTELVQGATLFPKPVLQGLTFPESHDRVHPSPPLSADVDSRGGRRHMPHVLLSALGGPPLHRRESWPSFAGIVITTIGLL